MQIPQEHRETLLTLAREAVESAVTGVAPPGAGELAGPLAEERGCFVTLTNQGKLRGCIGTFSPRGPLGEMIVEMGRAAANDPRFTSDPIRPSEVSELTVEVSVLSPLEETDEPEKLEIGIHGIYIVQGMRSGCFLPEVATDQGWNAEQFLDFCCAHKAGLPPKAWQDPDTKVYLFTSEKFRDEPA